MSFRRSRYLAFALAGLLAAVPGAARGQQDCLPPGSEQNQSAPICNIEPRVGITPLSTVVGQPMVPVSLAAEDEYSDNLFSSFRILLDDTVVTAQWPVTQTPMGTGTGVGLRFRSSGHVRLSPERPVRSLGVGLNDVQFQSVETSTYTLRLPGVEVGQDGGAVTVAPAATRTTTFTVRNTGTAAATFTVAAECRAAATGQRVEPCSVTPANPSVAAGQSTTVTATYPASQTGSTVNVLVRAQQAGTAGVQDAGWTDVTIQSATAGTPAPPSVTLVPLNAGATAERSLCTTVATAARGAYECGDLRIAHGLPVHRTRGRAWAPALLYNSQHAHPRPIVYADVAVQGSTPASVEMVVRMQDGVTHRASFAGSGFVPGVPRRVGVQWDALQTATGLYGYTVEVISHYAGGPQASMQYPGEIAIVNRSGSGFGAGWWLAGLESTLCADCGTGGSRLLWIGGDGSTRVFQEPAPGGWTTNVWTAQNPDGPPDTIRLAGGVYTRKLRGGGEVRYDGSGRHTHTINRLGQATQFTYGPYGISGIYAPGVGAGGPGTGDPAWTMNWDGAAWLVRSITASVHGHSRTTSLLIDGSRRVTEITDPDTRSAGFGYDPAVARRISVQRDRRGTYTYYGYDGAGKLSSARLQMGTAANAAVDPTSGFTAVEGVGVALENATGAASAPVSQAHTRMDGPRTDVADVTLLWPSAAGVVKRVRDPLGGETFVQHDARWPALPTQVTGPTGRVSRAQYDARGRVEAATVVNPLGDGRDQVTVYAYDDRWDAPVGITSYGVSGGTWTQLSGTARTAYDPATGHVLWKQVHDDYYTRVSFTYYTSGAAAGQVASVRGPSGVPGVAARDSLIYDARGNLRLSVSPLGYLSLVERDGLGRDTLSITPVTAAGAVSEAGLRSSGVRRRTTWDAMDRPVHTTTIGPAMQQAAGTSGVILPAQTAGDTLHVETSYDDEGLTLEVRRWVSPDPAQLHVLSTSYTYDAAGRKLTEVDGVGQQRFVYDLGGNVVRWITPRNDTITSRYDVMGRMVRRVVPEKRYAMSCPSQTNPCQNPYPAHPSGPSGSLVIPEEWTTFRFDPDGNMVYAENADAIVTRGYYRNGALRTDSLAIRSVEGMDFTTHRYGLSYAYNLAGQVTSLEHPTNLATNAQEQQDRYTYHPVTGALATLTDRRNHYFEFWRNAAGQMTRLRGPQYSDSLRYDLEGRLVKRVEWAALAGALHDDSIAYDARGKQTYVKVNAAGGRQASQYWQWYSGIGMLVGTDWQNEADNGRAQEAYGTDALGNVAWRRSDDGGGGTAHIRWDQAYDAGLGRLRTIESVNTGYLSGDFYPEKTTRSYDLAGNTDWTVLSQMGDIGAGNIDVVRDRRSRSYYGADQRLRYFQERDVRRADGMGGGTPELEGVWEEYRYDPLGRRVLVNTRTKDLCTTGTAFRCASATTRMVWAGDQLLWEIRRSSESPGETSTSAGSYGTVSYTHAGGIDRPLVITKGSTSILPHQNWRGQFSSGTYANGARSDCAPGVTTNCYPVAWPGYRTTAWHHDAKEPDIRAWWGGLVDGMRDASGQQYMRNRYYDPATGQFTQPDPIGIAGGLNSYGFAAGDPVSYDDPYGLRCEPWPECATGYWEEVAIEAHSNGNPLRAAGASLMGALAEVGNTLLRDQCGEELLCSGNARSVAPKISSRAARRAAMREQGIPTSRPADRQVRPRQAPADRQYQYDAPGGQTRTVTHHSPDPQHPNPHWEAGTAKQPVRTDPLGRQRYGTDKTKKEYDP
jgi:RHS repeat-associated protein